jgi:YVTN family beta-propeller protein
VNKNLRIRHKAILGIAVMIMLVVASTRLRAETGTCGGADITLPFEDVSSASIFFCSIASAYFAGLTSGTSATTYSPNTPVLRDQMAAFTTRTLDQALRRGSRRAALGQFWTISKHPSLFVTLNPPLNLIKSDGTDVYVAAGGENRVVRFVASGWQNGGTLANYTGIENAYGIVITPNLVYVTGRTNPGKLYSFSRIASPSPATLLTNSLGAGPTGIAYDGERIWTANAESDSVSIYNPTTFAVTTVPGFNNPFGILFDGANIWVTNYGRTTGNTLVKLDQNGAVIQTVTVGLGPAFPMFDGTNIWVPNYNENTISVVRAATGVVLATLSGNGLNLPNDIAFDGQRVVVTNNGGDSLSLWKATDLTPLGSVSTSPASDPVGVCSDGQDFWVTALFGNSGFLTKF